MATHNQPGDLRVNRGHILRRIGRATWPDGPKPGLPAPNRVEFSPSLALYFDSLAEAEQWATRYDLHPRTSHIGDVHHLVATGEWEGVDIGVIGHTRATAPEDGGPDDLSAASPLCVHAAFVSSAIECDGPVDRRVVWRSATAFDKVLDATGPLCRAHAHEQRRQSDASGSIAEAHIEELEPQSIEDAPPRGTDAAEVHVEPPADVDGFAHERGQPGWNAASGEQPTFASAGAEEASR